MAVRHVLLTGTLLRASGTPATGWVVAGLLAMVQAPGPNEVIVTQGEPVELVDGHFEVQVPVSTDPELSSHPLIELKLLLDDAPPEILVFPVDTSLGTIDLADVIPVPMPGPTGIPSVPWSAVGAPGGVAPLDGTGRVPAIYLPPLTGELITWWSGTGPPGPAIPGAAVGDMYFDTVGHWLYQLR
jgi:hypothetical protein